VFGVFGVSAVVSGQARQGGAAQPWPPVLSTPAPGDIEVVPVQGNVYMLVGAGANITVQSGRQGILLVDTGIASMSGKVLAALKSISSKPLRYIVNTSHATDHVGGNATISVTGKVPYRRAGDVQDDDAFVASRASVIAFVTVLSRMTAPTGQVSPTPPAAWPDETYSTPIKRISYNDEAVVITHVPASTDGNSIVLFRESDVVSAGDLLDLTGYPVIDIAAGGSIHAIVAGLNRLIEITVPAGYAQGGTMVIPGHGRLADHADVAYYRDMVAIIRDRIRDMAARKMTLAQVKAARPTREYDPRYGKNTGPWTTDMFVEAAYRSLTAPK
jgi:glyoxylase-like metal-dependent hydrolase (beta-lactamase superfamily II)